MTRPTSIAPSPVTSWRREDLVGMLTRDRHPLPRLFLKGERDAEGRPLGDTHRVEISCEYTDAGLIVRKKYRLGHVEHGRHENQVLELMRGWHLASGSIVMPGTIHHGRESEFEMPWQGLSLWDWIRLLERKFPPFMSVRAMLGLVRAILVKIRPLHEAGFVHGDLLYHNILIDYGQLGPDHPEHWYLDLASLRFIDFEFALTPTTFRKNNSTAPGMHRLWPRDDTGELIWLDDLHHSANLLPGTVDRTATSDRERLNPLPQAELEQRIQRTHWGSDFGTMAIWLHGWLTPTEKPRYRYKPLDFDEWEDADAWLRAFPARLRAFDKLAPMHEGVPLIPDCPHASLIAEIDDLIGADDRRSLAFVLDKATHAPPAPAPAAPTLIAPQPTRRRPEFHPRRDSRDEWAPELAIIQARSGVGIAMSADPIRLDQFLALTAGQDLRDVERRASKPASRFAPALRAPVVGLSRQVCEAWIAALNERLQELHGKNFPAYRLPTEAEWIEACSCGTGEAFTIGTRSLATLTPADAVYRYSQSGRSSRSDDPPGPQPVDDPRNQRNAWGLRGMHGNVREFATGIDDLTQTWIMGGGYASGARELHLRRTTLAAPDQRESDVGFRVVRNATADDIRAQFETTPGKSR